MNKKALEQRLSRQLLARQEIEAMQGQYPPPEILTLNVQSEVESCRVDCEDWRNGHYNAKPAAFFTASFTLNGYKYDIQLAKVKHETALLPLDIPAR